MVTGVRVEARVGDVVRVELEFRPLSVEIVGTPVHAILRDSIARAFAIPPELMGPTTRHSIPIAWQEESADDPRPSCETCDGRGLSGPTPNGPGDPACCMSSQRRALRAGLSAADQALSREVTATVSSAVQEYIQGEVRRTVEGDPAAPPPRGILSNPPVSGVNDAIATAILSFPRTTTSPPPRPYCPGCESEANPVVERLTVEWCHSHNPSVSGTDDAIATAALNRRASRMEGATGTTERGGRGLSTELARLLIGPTDELLASAQLNYDTIRGRIQGNAPGTVRICASHATWAHLYALFGLVKANFLFGEVSACRCELEPDHASGDHWCSGECQTFGDANARHTGHYWTGPSSVPPGMDPFRRYLVVGNTFRHPFIQPIAMNDPSIRGGCSADPHLPPPSASLCTSIRPSSEQTRSLCECKAYIIEWRDNVR